MVWIPAACHVVAQLTLRNPCDSFETGKRKTFAVIRQEGGNIVTEIKIQIFKSFPVCFVFINPIQKMKGGGYQLIVEPGYGFEETSEFYEREELQRMSIANEF